MMKLKLATIIVFEEESQASQPQHKPDGQFRKHRDVR